MSSNTPVLDPAIQNDIKYLLSALKLKGSTQLKEVMEIVEKDFENVKNMSAGEILNYLRR